MGGYNSEGVLNDDSVESYSFDTKQWTLWESQMAVPRWGHSAAVYRGQLLVLGGRDEIEDDINNIEVYDPDTKQWKVHSNLTIPWELGRDRYYSSLVVL